MIVFFVVILMALIFVSVELKTRSVIPYVFAHFLLRTEDVLMVNINSVSNLFGYFRDKPTEDPKDPSTTLSWKDRVRAAGRTFVLGVADAQTILVAAFLLSFAGQSKCKLTSYHFGVAVNQMMIALSVITFSVALVRTYWRSPLAAAFRLLLSTGAFIGVGLTILRKANYAPDWPPRGTRRDSASLLPVACLLDLDLRSRAEEQAKDSVDGLGFGKATAWPPERGFYIVLILAFLAAHCSILFRFAEKRKWIHTKSTQKRKYFTLVYWPLVLITPTATSVQCWRRVYEQREWVDKSGWIASPNPEMIVWDSGQLIAMGILITVIINVLTETFERKKKDTKKRTAAGEEFAQLTGGESATEMHSMGFSEQASWQRDGYEPHRRYATA
jgi:hypothetical protein